MDPSGNSLLFCSIFDYTCDAICVCNTGFGGKDCSLNAASLSSRDGVRCVSESVREWMREVKFECMSERANLCMRVCVCVYV